MLTPKIGTDYAGIPGEFLLSDNAIRIGATVAASATSRIPYYGSVAAPDSRILAGGTVMGQNSAYEYVPVYGSELVSAPGAGALVLFVKSIGLFKVADNVFVSDAGGTDQEDLGAITAVYTTTKSFAVTNSLTGAGSIGMYAWVCNSTNDGPAGDPKGILLDSVKMVDLSGNAASQQATIVKFGYVDASAVINLSARAKKRLRDSTVDGTMIIFDE